MPRSRRRKQRAAESASLAVSNLTIYDAAHNPSPVNRVPKAAVKQNKKVGENEECEAPVDGKIKSKGKRPQSAGTEETQVDGKGEDGYPIDLWYLISNYIDARDVVRFALICRATLSIVRSANFWRSLYKRTYATAAPEKKLRLPLRLHPSFMYAPVGLRTRVVRALYYLHPRLSRRVSALKSSWNSQRRLVGAQCTLVWSTTDADVLHHYYFKFERGSTRTRAARKKIMDNPEEGCRVLEVVSLRLYPSPLVLGYFLDSVSAGIYYNDDRTASAELELKFSPAGDRVAPRHVIIHDVEAVHVHTWWDPDYPCQVNYISKKK